MLTGAIYIDGTNGTDKADDGVPPNKTHKYIWSIRQNESPTGNNTDSLPWSVEGKTCTCDL